MNVKEGLTTGPNGPEMEVSDQALAAQAQIRAQTSETHSVPESNGVAIRHALLEGPVVETDIRAGLTSAADVDRHGHTAAERAQIKAEHEAFVRSPEGQKLQADAEAAQLAADDQALELATFRRGALLEQFLMADTAAEQAFSWSHMDEVARAEAREQFLLSDEDVAELEQEARLGVAEAQEADNVALAFQSAVEAVNSRRAAFEQLAAERGLDPDSPQALQWLNGLAAFAEQAGANLTQLDGEQFAAAMRGAEATIQGTVKSQQDAAFKRALLDTDDTSITGGLTKLGANGWQHIEPRPDIKPQPVDFAKVVRAMNGNVGETAEQVRASVASETAMSADYRRVQAIGATQFETTRRKAAALGIDL
jgi:hypothetical protein